MVRAGTDGTLGDRVLFFTGKPFKASASPLAVMLVERLQYLAGILLDQAGWESKSMLGLRHRYGFLPQPQFSAHRMNHHLIIRLAGLIHLSVQHHIGNLGDGHYHFRDRHLSLRQTTAARLLPPAPISTHFRIMPLAGLCCGEQRTRPAFLVRSPSHSLSCELPSIIPQLPGVQRSALIF